MAFGNLSVSRIDSINALRPERGRAFGAERSRSPHSQSPTESRGLDPNLPGLDPKVRALDPKAAERTRLQTRSSEEGSLTLTTAEGDKITISFRNQQSTSLDQAKLYGPDGSFERTRVKSKESSTLSVRLEGDLSDDELEDITALVSKLSSSLQAARSGDFDAAQQQLAAPSDLGSIANYNFAYQQSTDVSYQATRLSVTA